MLRETLTELFAELGTSQFLYPPQFKWAPVNFVREFPSMDQRPVEED